MKNLLRFSLPLILISGCSINSSNNFKTIACVTASQKNYKSISAIKAYREKIGEIEFAKEIGAVDAKRGIFLLYDKSLNALVNKPFRVLMGSLDDRSNDVLIFEQEISQPLDRNEFIVNNYYAWRRTFDSSWDTTINTYKLNLINKTRTIEGKVDDCIFFDIPSSLDVKADRTPMTSFEYLPSGRSMGDVRELARQERIIK